MLRVRCYVQVYNPYGRLWHRLGNIVDGMKLPLQIANSWDISWAYKIRRHPLPGNLKSATEDTWLRSNTIERGMLHYLQEQVLPERSVQGREILLVLKSPSPIAKSTCSSCLF